MIKLIKLLEDTRAAQIRRRKWRMINESENQLEYQFTPDQYHELEDLILQAGGDLEPFIDSDSDGDINEAEDYQTMPIASLEKLIQSKLDKDIYKKIVNNIVKSKGSDRLKQLSSMKFKDRSGEENIELKKLEDEFLKKNSSEIEREFKAQKQSKKITIKINKNVLEETKIFIKDMNEFRDWYYNINKKIMDEFGDSDGVLFLILLAILSPRNRLNDNLKFASQLYVALKTDEENHISKAALNKILTTKKQESIISMVVDSRKNAMLSLIDKKKNPELMAVMSKPITSLDSKEQKLYTDFISANKKAIYDKTKEYMGEVDSDVAHSVLFDALSQPGMGMISSYMPNLLRVMRDYVNNGFMFSREEVVTKLRSFWTPKGTLKKEATISAEKVFSFTLNLLDPTYETLQEFNPVTIDTWMLLYFYPHLSKDEREALIQKAGAYTFMSRKIQQLAKKLNLKPLELQAMIWVAMIRKETNDPNYSVRYEDALEKEAQKADEITDNLEQIEKFFMTDAKNAIDKYRLKYSVVKIGKSRPKN